MDCYLYQHLLFYRYVLSLILFLFFLLFSVSKNDLEELPLFNGVVPFLGTLLMCSLFLGTLQI